MPPLLKIRDSQPPTGPDVLKAVLSGKEFISTHAGTSQYSQTGSSSACGLATLNCIRHILCLESQGESADELVKKILLNETMEDIMSICIHWTSSTHLEVDDIYKTPLFENSLKLVSIDYGKAGEGKFEEMLCQLSKPYSRHYSCAVAITRPPEIVTCLKISHPLRDLFVIFDSHPRPAHPSGAAFTFFDSRKSAVQYLVKLFPVDDRLLAPDSDLQWQAELLAHVSGHFFESSRNDMCMSREATFAFAEASCAILHAKARESELKSQCDFLTSENDRLRQKLEGVNEQMELAKRDSVARSAEKKELWELRELRDTMERITLVDHLSDTNTQIRGRAPIFRPQESSSSHRTASDKPQQEIWHADHNYGRMNHSSITSTKGKSKAVDTFEEEDENIQMVLQIQMEYAAEDAALGAQLKLLQATNIQSTFHCSICMDELLIDDVSRIDDCQHSFCRGCIRQYISSKLEDRKFPIPCPCCTTEEGRGSITESLIHQIGISEKAYSVFNELQITKFSVPMDCKRCSRSAFVDKAEFEQTKILFCPFPNCAHSWCKDCQQPVTRAEDGPIHSCDGTEEFNHLMSRRGWKHCPGCKTPTEKIEGCNHMTCGSTGCNTHFCYTCGGLIIQSARRSDIKAAVNRHYTSNCSLFHVPRED